MISVGFDLAVAARRGRSYGSRARSISGSSEKAGGRPVLAQKILQKSIEAENALADVLVT